MFFAKEMAATVVLDFQGAQRSSKIEAPFPANTSTGFLAVPVVAFTILAEPLGPPFYPSLPVESKTKESKNQIMYKEYGWHYDAHEKVYSDEDQENYLKNECLTIRIPFYFNHLSHPSNR